MTAPQVDVFRLEGPNKSPETCLQLIPLSTSTKENLALGTANSGIFMSAQVVSATRAALHIKCHVPSLPFNLSPYIFIAIYLTFSIIPLSTRDLRLKLLSSAPSALPGETGTHKATEPQNIRGLHKPLRNHSSKQFLIFEQRGPGSLEIRVV